RGSCRCWTRSWRYTRCWCWTGQARANYVNKTRDYLLVALLGVFQGGDEEAAFIFVGDYRAASWRLDCALENVHCVAEQESIRRQQLHPNSTRIRIGPSDQVNPIDRI